MKKKLLFLFTFLITTCIINAQVVANQVDDFEDGTVMDWFEGGPSPNPPVIIATGGPSGANDNYMQADSDYPGSGAIGPGHRQVIRNVVQWSGDYSGQGIVEIQFDARVFTNDLNLRIAMSGPGGRIATINAVTVTAGSGWTNVSIPIQPSDFVAVAGAPSIPSVLASCFEFRILSNTAPAWEGEAINSRLELDNITASTTLSTLNFNQNPDFSIYPNPGKSKMNITLSDSTSNAKVEVFNVLGKRILVEKLTDLRTTIDVSKWKTGVYLVKITSDNTTQTKRFVKQ